MTFTVIPLVAVILTVTFLLLFSGEELFAQERGKIQVDRAVALPLTTAEGNQVKVVVNYDIDDESLIGQLLMLLWAYMIVVLVH